MQKRYISNRKVKKMLMINMNTLRSPYSFQLLLELKVQKEGLERNGSEAINKISIFIRVKK